MTTTRRHRIATVAALLALLTTPIAATAQSTSPAPARWEFLISSGKLMPTGTQRSAIASGGITAAQLWFVPGPVALTATLGWARTRDLVMTSHPKLDAFVADVGAEVRAPRVRLGRLGVIPFGGAGAGVRSYNHRRLDLDATHNLAGYVSAGSELGIGRVRLRVELRDYVSGFKALDGEGATATRNDVVLMAGLRLAARR